MKSEALKFWETSFWWIVALTLIVPLVIAPHIVMGIVFIKLTLFQILVALLLAIYFILWALNPDKYKPRLTWLTLIVGLFAVVLILSTIFSIQPFTSLWGSAFRMNGLFSYLHFFVYFWILSWVIKGSKQWLKLLQITIFASLAVILYGLVEYFSLSITAELDGDRVVSTLVNSLTLAQYLLLLFFPTLIYGLKTKSFKLRWWLLSIAFLQFVTIFLTGARGAMIALVIGSIVFVLCYIWAYRKEWFKKALVVSFGTVVILGLFVWGLKQLPPTNNFVLIRIASIDLSDPTVQTRLHAWKIALNASKEKLVFGYGLENFELAFNKYYEPFAEKFSNNETWFDRAHSSFIDYLVMTGILGLLAYIGLLIIAFWRSFKVFAKKINGWKKHLAIALIPMLVAYTIFSISAFDAGSIYIIFFFLLALLNSIDTKKLIKTSNKTSSIAWLLCIVSVGVLVVLLPINYKHIVADKTAGRAIATFYKKDFALALELANESLDYGTFINPAVSNKMIQAGRNLLATEGAVNYIDTLTSIGDMFENTIINLDNGKYYTALGDYYGELIPLDANMVEKMNQAFDLSAQFAPNRPFLYLNWGSILTTGLERYTEAIDKYKIAVEIYPEFPLAHFWLGIGQIYDGQLEVGNQSLITATKLGLNIETPNIAFVLASAFEKIKKYPEAQQVYLKLIDNIGAESIEPYYATLSFYYRIGWYREAYDLANNYLAKYPGDEVVIELIAKIKEQAPYIK